MAWIDRLNRLIGEKLAWLYLVAVAITSYEVVMRYVLNLPTTFGFELTVFLCATAYLLSGGYVTARDEHIAITSLQTILPPAWTRALKLFGHVIGVVAMVGLIWASWKAGLNAATIVERTGSAWDAPTPAIVKPMITVAAVLVLLQLLVNILRLLRGRA